VGPSSGRATESSRLARAIFSVNLSEGKPPSRANPSQTALPPVLATNARSPHPITVTTVSGPWIFCRAASAPSLMRSCHKRHTWSRCRRVVSPMRTAGSKVAGISRFGPIIGHRIGLTNLAGRPIPRLMSYSKITAVHALYFASPRVPPFSLDHDAFLGDLTTSAISASAHRARRCPQTLETRSLGDKDHLWGQRVTALGSAFKRTSSRFTRRGRAIGFGYGTVAAIRKKHADQR